MERLEHKKVYIRDIRDNEELIRNIVKDNSKLLEEEYRVTYEDNMFSQEEYYKQWNVQGVYIKDNYDSFYLKIYDYDKFINNFNEFTGNDLLKLEYEKAMELYNEKNNIYFSSENADELYDELDERFEDACDNLLEQVEKMLKEYENITEEDVIEHLVFNIMENNAYEDLYYYEDNDKYILYEDIVKSYE